MRLFLLLVRNAVIQSALLGAGGVFAEYHLLSKT